MTLTHITGSTGERHLGMETKVQQSLKTKISFFHLYFMLTCPLKLPWKREGIEEEGPLEPSVLTFTAVYIQVTQGGVPVRRRSEGKGSMQGTQFGFFISWFLLKKYIDNQGENFLSSCIVLALQCRKANGNKIFETQRIGYFRSFLFLIFPQQPFIRISSLLKEFWSLFHFLFFSLTSRFLEFQELQTF